MVTDPEVSNVIISAAVRGGSKIEFSVMTELKMFD